MDELKEKTIAAIKKQLELLDNGGCASAKQDAILAIEALTGLLLT